MNQRHLDSLKHNPFKTMVPIMKHALALLTALLLAPPAALWAANEIVVENGLPCAEIVVAGAAPRSVRLAAGELQTYVEKITGGRLAIVTSPTESISVKVYVGESEHASRVGVDAEGLERDAFRMKSGPDWLALVGRDWDFTPAEPWARSRTDWLNDKQAEWMKLAGHPWQNPVAASLYKDYSKQLDVWNFDHRGSLNAVYVWKFVVRIANELAKTHPERKVFCGAYSTYRLPPLSIDKLPDNVWVQITNGRPIRELDNETHEYTAELRRRWQAKTRNPLSVTLNYTPFTNRGEYRPQYWPHVIARGLRDTAGEVWREDVWLASGKGGLHHPGMSHLNPYIMSRLWWDTGQDVDALLEEYYRLFYGPAASEMKAFIEFCETNYAGLGSDGKAAAEALQLFDQAKAAAVPDSVFGRRIALVDEFLITLRNRSSQMQSERPAGLPQFRVIDMGRDKWRDARDTLVIDGRIDEPFWTGYSLRGNLKDVRTGEKPKFPTYFRVRWWKDSLYFAIRCEGEPGVSPIIGGGRDGDPAIWNGEHLELLIETDKHSYYQIVLNPAGFTVNLDRGVAKKNWFDWSAHAEVAAHRGDDFWSVEVKLPVTSSDEDPLHQVVGSMPFKSKADSLQSGKGTSLPWYFNLFRKRAGSEDEETTAFSPLGPEAKTFHDPQKFSEIYVQ
jgi:hypothetical protein